MTVPPTTPPTTTSDRAPGGPAPRRTSGRLRFAGHYLEMVAAMLAGMFLLDPLWPAELTAGPAVGALVMASDMTLAMALWMTVRGHRPRRTAEMCAVMVAPVVVLLPFHLQGAVSGPALMAVAHVAMFPLMLAAMLWRRAEYLHR